MLKSMLPSQVISGDPGNMLRMLQEQQASATVQLTNARQMLREAEMNAKLTGGADEPAARALVVQNQIRVARLKQTLGMIDDRLASAQDAFRSAPTGVAIAQEQSRIFNLKPAEFYSAMGFVLWFPVMLAFARRLWRSAPSRTRREEVGEGSPQIDRLEQAVEAIAIEVERISEAQRFSAKLLAERPVEPISEPTPRRAKRPVITPLP